MQTGRGIAKNKINFDRICISLLKKCHIPLGYYGRYDSYGTLWKVLLYKILQSHDTLSCTSSVFSMCSSQQNLVLIISVVVISISFLLQLCTYFNGQKICWK